VHGVEGALMAVLISRGDPVPTTLIRWLITGEHAANEVTIDIGWHPPGTPNPLA
jgi:hypothetical protein